MITCFNRFGEDNEAAPILRKMSKHEIEHNCEVCLLEEAKSPSLKINRTKIIERVILPSDECWICDLKFDDSDSQVNHFAEHHECEFCSNYCDSLSKKSKHLLDEHECPICGKCFEKNDLRNDHILDVHGLHACEHCEKHFQTESEMDDHFSTDHFKCGFCWRYYDSLQKRREHVLDVHECPNYEKQFEYQFQKRDHIEKEHPNSDF